jgi:hypothetical protein
VASLASAWQKGVMISRRNKRVAWLGALASVAGIIVAGSIATACSSNDNTGATGGAPDATAGDGRGGSDSSTEEDGSVPELDASKDAGLDARDANTRDANGPGALDEVCSFNWDCQVALRCECDEATGCACKSGVRGTGRNGIDPCTSGNNCTSAVCIEGPPDSGSFCSDECGTSADCVGKLPLCQTIAFVGRICTRTPPP